MPDSLIRFSNDDRLQPVEIEARLADGTPVPLVGDIYRVSAVPYHVRVDVEPGTHLEIRQRVIDPTGTLSEMSEWSNTGHSYPVPIPVPEPGVAFSLLIGALTLAIFTRLRGR